MTKGRAMKRKPNNIVIALPCYTGQIHIGTHRSVLHDMMRLFERGDSVREMEECGNADISLCRAMIIAKFLQVKDATHLIMVDSDVCWESGGLIKLVDAGVDFVCAAYPQRLGDDRPKFHMHMLPGATQSLDKNTQLFEVQAMPAGLMCLTRSMLERMIAHYPDSKISFEQCPNGVAWDLFDGIREEDNTGLVHKYGEDYSFCKRWRAMGGRVFVDPFIATGHLGTKLWQGRLSDSFQAVPKQDAA